MIFLVALAASSRPVGAAQGSEVPAWLKAHVGEDEGEIAEPVLQRARALYLRKRSEGAIKNPCYFAMDATRPSMSSAGAASPRFYMICESDHLFRAISAGHGSGRRLDGMPDFSNGRRCAKNFSNAMDSELTAGGAYVTAETKASFKGYYRISARENAVLIRPFVQFDGEGDTSNARLRAIGGHAAIALKGVCLRRDPRSPYASEDGYVPFGTVVDYTGGRSNGCTSWSPSDAAQIVSMVKGEPTTLYIYPDASVVEAVAQAVAIGKPLPRAALYWNASCLKEINAPKYWPREILEPLLDRYKKGHPAPPPRPIPICKP